MAFGRWAWPDPLGWFETTHLPYRGITRSGLRSGRESAQAGCEAHYTGNPVYQTQWMLITSNAQNWIELGTGHQCSDTLGYWFWGYGYLGDWYPQGSLAGQATATSW